MLEEERVNSNGLVRGYVAEQSGIPLGALLYNNQHGEDDCCGKIDCNPCNNNTTKKMSCHKVRPGGMVYSCYCDTCLQGRGEDGEDPAPVESWYHGETSRTLYSRQKEHVTGLASKKENNALYKHKELHHSSGNPKFVFQAEKFINEPVSKQIFEGCSINHSPSSPGFLMNSKAEFRQGDVARVVIVRGLGE